MSKVSGLTSAYITIFIAALYSGAEMNEYMVFASVLFVMAALVISIVEYMMKMEDRA